MVLAGVDRSIVATRARSKGQAIRRIELSISDLLKKSSSATVASLE